MTTEELREFKQGLLDKYTKTKDKDIRHLMRTVDKIIKKKVENDR